MHEFDSNWASVEIPESVPTISSIDLLQTEKYKYYQTRLFSNSSEMYWIQRSLDVIFVNCYNIDNKLCENKN